MRFVSRSSTSQVTRRGVKGWAGDSNTLGRDCRGGVVQGRDPAPDASGGHRPPRDHNSRGSRVVGDRETDGLPPTLTGGATLVAPATGVASAGSGLGCHTLPTLTVCLLSPSVAGGGTPGHASCALQPLDDKTLSAFPAGWHGLCSLRERRPDGGPGGGRRGERSPMRHVASGTTVDRRAQMHSS
jgi:hypothetical protein